jgi:hypothetical protein
LIAALSLRDAENSMRTRVIDGRCALVVDH